VTALADACAELARWLPAAETLITAPDADGTSGHGQPSSRPPWNSAAAEALLDALEGVRQLEASWRSGPLRPMAQAGTVLASIVRLSHAVSDGEQRQAVTMVSRWTVSILQLPAVDEAERPLRVAAPCVYCGFAMLRVYPRSGRVTCLRFGVCQDSEGNHPVGVMGRSQLDGSPCVTWNDGLVT
jgi:hypothetical protein